MHLKILIYTQLIIFFVGGITLFVRFLETKRRGFVLSLYCYLAMHARLNTWE